MSIPSYEMLLFNSDTFPLQDLRVEARQQRKKIRMTRCRAKEIEFDLQGFCRLYLAAKVICTRSENCRVIPTSKDGSLTMWQEYLIDQMESFVEQESTQMVDSKLTSALIYVVRHNLLHHLGAVAGRESLYEYRTRLNYPADFHERMQGSDGITWNRMVEAILTESSKVPDNIIEDMYDVHVLETTSSPAIRVEFLDVSLRQVFSAEDYF